jgi:hypothetical protein
LLLCGILSSGRLSRDVAENAEIEQVCAILHHCGSIKNELRPALSAVKRMDVMGSADEKQPGQVGLAGGQIRFWNDGV